MLERKGIMPQIKVGAKVANLSYNVIFLLTGNDELYNINDNSLYVPNKSDSDKPKTELFYSLADVPFFEESTSKGLTTIPRILKLQREYKQQQRH